MSIPVWVHVYWSESRKFKENELVPFVEFEKRAKSVAILRSRKAALIQSYTGYYKTKVNALFDNGNIYECRLDLALRETVGFKDYALQMIAYYEHQKDDSSDVVRNYKANYEFLKQIHWP